MDYARQNYVAQPGDGLQPKDFIRRLGPFDDFVDQLGLPRASRPSAPREKRRSIQWITNQTGRFPYRFVPGDFGSLDPRSQTEDMGDDPVKSSTYAVANYKRMIPNLVAWTTKPGDDYTDLQELYTEGLGQWSTYMGHVAGVIAGVNVDLQDRRPDGRRLRRGAEGETEGRARVSQRQRVHHARLAPAGVDLRADRTEHVARPASRDPQ